MEGHINRLKMLKRQMFGRARLDLFAPACRPLEDRFAARLVAGVGQGDDDQLAGLVMRYRRDLRVSDGDLRAIPVRRRCRGEHVV